MKISQYNIIKSDTKWAWIYNTFSSSFIKVEYPIWNTIVTNAPFEDRDLIVKTLTEQGILVEDDENELAKYKFFYNQGIFDQRRLHIDVIPTMQCNFACPYCFEEGYKNGPMMTDEVEDALIRFLTAQKERNLSIGWFGGEPMIGFERLLSISEKLDKEGIAFTSSMITNGSLFTEEKIRLLERLHLQTIQISMDGLAEEHDKRRCFKSGLPDHLLLSVNTIFKVNKKLSSMPSLLFNMKWRKFTTRLSYAYDDQYYKYNNTNYRYIYHKNYTYSRFSPSDILENNRTHRVQWGTDFTLDKNNVFSFLYSYSFVRDRNDRTNQITTQDSLKTESYETEGNSRSRRNQHSFSLSYDHTFKDNSKLWITTDYATIRSTNDYHSYEYYPTSDYRRATNSTSHSSYNIYTTSLDYAFKLPGSIETETGFKYSNTHTPSNSSTDNPSAIALGYTDRTVMDDRILAGYLNLSKKWKKLNVDVGGRYEFAQTRVRAWTENKEKQVNRYFSNFLPNIKALYRFNESWAVYTSYKQTINRPTFYDLDPSVVYRDSMTYSGGNTRAVPSLRHDYTIGAQWKNIYLEIGLTNTKNFSDRANICINEHSNAVVNVPFILPSIYFYKVRLNGYKNFKKWYLYGAATCFIPHARFSDPQIVWRPKIATVKLTGNIIYQFTDHLGVSVFLEYQGENEQFLYKQEGALRSYFTLDGTFLKKKLNVSLFVWDPFNLANYNKIYTHYMNVRDGSTGYSKSRCIGISITYKFLNKELNVKAKQKNEKELERTEKR